jgi:hypothetical protein
MKTELKELTTGLPIKLELIDDVYLALNDSTNIPVIRDNDIFNMLYNEINNSIKGKYGENILVSKYDLDKYLKYKDKKYSTIFKDFSGHGGFDKLDINDITNIVINTIRNNSLMNISKYFFDTLNLIARDLYNINQYFEISEIAEINTYLEYIKELMDDMQSSNLPDKMVTPILSKLQDIKVSVTKIGEINRWKLHSILQKNNQIEALNCFIKIKYCSIIKIYTVLIITILSEDISNDGIQNTYNKINKILETIDDLNNCLMNEKSRNDENIINQENRWDAKYWINMYWDKHFKVQELDNRNKIIEKVRREISETSEELYEKLKFENIKLIIKPIDKFIIKRK